MKVTWINASAGTGKTKSLVDQCLYLVAQGVKPENILCITFTNNAVREMQERLAPQKFQIKTLHSVAQGIVQHIYDIQIDRILDDYDQEIFLRKAVQKYFSENPHRAEILSAQYSYGYFLSLLKKVLYKTKTPLQTFAYDEQILKFESLKGINIENEEEYFEQFLTVKGTIRKRINADDMEEAENVYRYKQSLLIQQWMSKNNIFLECFNGIMKYYLDFKNGYDFNDLILEAIDLLQDESHLYQATKNFHHVLLDEAQDTSYHQWRLFKKLIENAQTVFVVGDNKQNIYSFQDASPEFYEAFKQEIKDVSQFEERILTVNYRSLNEIVQLAEKKCPDLLIPHQTVFRKGEGVYDDVMDYQHIIDLLNSSTILPSTQRKIEPQDILLLFRKRDDAFDAVMTFLKQNDILVNAEKKHIFQDDPLVKEIMHLINLQIYYPHDAYDVFYYDRSSLKTMGIPMLFDSVELMMVSFMGVIPDVIVMKLMEVMANLKALTFYMLREYLERHVLFFEHESNENAVTMMTIHGSKGLQAPVVYLFDTSNKVPYDPFLYDITKNALYMTPPLDIQHPSIVGIREHHKNKLEDESKRLLYVAITRAKDQFYFVKKVD